MQHIAISSHRRHERTPVKAHTLVHAHGHFQSATVIDFSLGGVQLEGTFGLFQRDAVEIEFLSGTRVAGMVAWSVGARAAVAFSEALPETHAAIVELARRAAMHEAAGRHRYSG
jgi:hypothetical protein